MKTSHLISACAVTLVSLFSAMHAQADGVLEPIPSFYQEPGLSPNRKYVNQHANEHIDPFTGKLQWHYTDLFIPGNGGFDLAVQRSYSSLGEEYPEPSPAGYGWTMHFGRVLRRASVDICDVDHGATLNPVLELPDGSRQILYVALDGMSFITTGFWKAVCNTSSGGSGGLTVYSPDGTRYDMTKPGAPLGDAVHPVNTYYTSMITDRNGNWMSLSYEFVGLSFGVTHISTSDGRAVDFSYSNGLISSVTDGARTWKYLGGGGFLSEVQRPDGTSWKYAYNSISAGSPGSGSITKVTYPTGGTIDYGYGFVNFSPNPNLPRSSVITSKTVGAAGQNTAAAGTWSYSYKPATASLPPVPTWTSFPDDQVDKTTVSGPDGTRVYRHIGYTSVPPGGVNQIGQPIEAVIGNSHAESYSHTAELISYQTNIRPGDTLTFDDATYASIFLGKNISRNGQSYNSFYDSLDEFGNPLSITETGTDTRKTAVSYAIDTGKWILHLKKDESSTVNDLPVGSITRSFDPSGNLLSENRYGVNTDFTYTAAGDVATRTDARNKQISYSDYHRGIPQNELHPEGVLISRMVSGSGNVTSQTDGELAKITYDYDALNRLTKIAHPLGNPVNVLWGSNTRTTTRGNYTERVTFDSFGREAQVMHSDSGTGESIVQTNEYDTLGRRIFASYPNATIGTHYLYDTVGQLRQVGQAFDPASGLAMGWRTYNRAGNTVTVNDVVTDTHDVNTTYTYRGFSDPDHLELMSVAAPVASASISMKRNGVGQLTEATQDGKTRAYGYDAKYFLTSKSDPETGFTIYGRDAVGNMTSRKVGTSAATTYVYDGLNRLSTTLYPDGTSVQRTYYKDDKLKSVDNGVAVQTYVYDANKNLKTENLTVAGQSFATQYLYDGNDALNTLTYGSGKVVTYSPDAFGRPTQAAPYVTKVMHHPSGAISSMTYANGVKTDVGLNNRLWPSTLKIGAATSMFDKAYYYDRVGNVTGIDDAVDKTRRDMTYDDINRLVTATAPSSGTYKASYVSVHPLHLGKERLTLVPVAVERGADEAIVFKSPGGWQVTLPASIDAERLAAMLAHVA